MNSASRANLAAAYESFTKSPSLAEREQALSWFQLAWPELREAIHAESEQSEEDAVAISHMTAPFLYRLGAWAELEEQSRMGAALTAELGLIVDCALFLNRWGVSLQQLRQDENAEQILAHAESLAKAINDPNLEASAIAHRGQLRQRAGEAGEAAILLHRAAGIYRAEGDRQGEARTLGNLASVSAELGDEAGSEAYDIRSRDIFHSLGDLDGEARAVWKLADARVRRRDLQAGVRLLDQAIDLFRAVPAPPAAAEAGFAAARLLEELGDHRAALTYAGAAHSRTSPSTSFLRDAIWDFIEYVEASIALQELLSADSNEARDRVLSERPVLFTDQALTLALPARVESDEARAAVDRLLNHPESAAARWFQAEWDKVQTLAGEEVLNVPSSLHALVRQLFVPSAASQAADVLQQIVAIVPAEIFPGIHGNYLLQLARVKAASHERDDGLDDAIAIATDAAMLLRRAEADLDAADALVQVGSWWRQRHAGDARRNADQALTALRQALLIYRRPDHPQQWASTMMSIANVYGQYPNDRRTNLTRAANRLAAAMRIFTPERHSEAYATALSNLGKVLSDTALANDPENLERARRYLTRSLGMADDPVLRAAVLLNLGLCYRNRVQGDHDANLDNAVQYARESYNLSEALDMPVGMSDAATGVADALAMRALHASRTEGPDLAESIEWYRRALAAVPVERAPLSHAATADNLANTIGLLRDDNAMLDEAIALHEKAIDLYHRFGDSGEESRAIYNLASTLGRKPNPDHSRIVSLYEASLIGRPVDEAPFDWAESTTQLARAFLERATEGDNDRAIALLQHVIEVAGADPVPALVGEAWIVLGRAYGRQGDWHQSAQALRCALTAADARYLAAVLSTGQQAELTRIAGLPREAAYALAMNGDLMEAIAVVEGARARELVRLLERDWVDLSRLEEAAPEVAAIFRIAGERLAAIEARQRETFGSDEERRELRAMLIDAQAEFEIATQSVRVVPGFADFKQAPPNAAEQVARGGSPLVYLITAEYGSVALVMTARGEAEAVFGPLSEEELVRALTGVTTQRIDDFLNPVLDLIGTRFIGALAQRLLDMKIGYAVLVPTGMYGALPIHAARYRRDARSRHFLDDVEVSYAPSARALLAVRGGASYSPRTSFLGVAEPLPTSSPLPSAVAEVAATLQLFPGPGEILERNAATKAAFLARLPDASHVHLACHGNYDPEQPLQSSLHLAEGDRLTLRELFDGKHSRLGWLGCCWVA